MRKDLQWFIRFYGFGSLIIVSLVVFSFCQLAPEKEEILNQITFPVVATSGFVDLGGFGIPEIRKISTKMVSAFNYEKPILNITIDSVNSHRIFYQLNGIDSLGNGMFRIGTLRTKLYLRITIIGN